jgi:hypothetical protein
MLTASNANMTGVCFGRVWPQINKQLKWRKLGLFEVEINAPKDTLVTLFGYQERGYKTEGEKRDWWIPFGKGEKNR